ncbi:MAG TPA: hypothetical protein VGN40_00850 [Lelliottia sp.]
MNRFINCLAASFRIFKKWISGDYSLVMTYWVTGVIPQVVIAISIYSFIINVIGQSTDPSALMRPFLTLAAFALIYTLCSYIAIVCSAVKYSGPKVWRILAILAVVRGCIELVKTVIFFIQELV